MRSSILFSIFAVAGTLVWWSSIEGPKKGSNSELVNEIQVQEEPENSTETAAFSTSSIETEQASFSEELPTASSEERVHNSPVLTGIEPIQIQLSIAEEATNLPEYEAWTKKAEFKQLKNVEAPIAGVDAPASTRLVFPEMIKSGGIIDLGSGAFLRLAPDVLVTKDGRSVDEEVKFSYCQLSDPVDIYVSGIPMKYDSAGMNGTFQTAGMVRLEASLFSGEEVFVKEGKSLQLDMPTVNEADDFNFYEYDGDKGAWEFASASPSARMQIDLMMDTAYILYPFDTTSFATKFDNVKYRHLIHPSAKREPGRVLRNWAKSNQKGIISKGLYGTRYGRVNNIRLNPYQVTTGYTDKKKPIQETRFKIGFVPGKQILFREIRHFNNYSFMIDDVEKRSAFYARYRRGRHFNDIRIEYEEGESYCTIFLKDENEIMELQARICGAGDENFASFVRTRFMRSYKRYKKDVMRKAKTHDKMIHERMTSQFLRVSAQLGQFGNWATKPYRILKLPRLGLFNCDRIAVKIQPKPIRKELQLEDGTPLLAEKMVFFDHKAGATYSCLMDEDPECSAGGIAYAIFYKGDKKYYVSGKKYLDFTSNRKRVLEVKELPEVQSSNELRKVLTSD